MSAAAHHSILARKRKVQQNKRKLHEHLIHGRQSLPDGYARIRWIDPRSSTFRCRTHPTIEREIAENPLFRGRHGHGNSLANELRLFYHQCVLNKHGHGSVSRRRLEGMYSSHVRKQFMTIVRRLFGLVRDATASRCCVYAFLGESPTDKSSSVSLVLIPGRLLVSRALAWRNWCHKQGLECHLDIDGSTKWGKAAFRGLDAIAIPLNNIDAFEGTEKQKTHAIERVHKLTQVGVLSLVYRRKGRLYHALSSLRGTTRERCLMHYEGRWHAVAEADVHACFWSVLASRVGCPDLIKALQKREFYSSLRGDFEGSDGDLKVEVQRQCLFWRDARLSERPIWRRLCRLYPLLATLITKLRRQNGVTDLAAFLMRSEAKTMVDGVLPSINFPAVGLHDGVLTPSSCAASAAQTISKLARADWGFAPAVRAK